ADPVLQKASVAAQMPPLGRLRGRAAAHADRQAREAASARSLLAEAGDREDMIAAHINEEGPGLRGSISFWLSRARGTGRRFHRRLRGRACSVDRPGRWTTAAERILSGPIPGWTPRQGAHQSARHRP